MFKRSLAAAAAMTACSVASAQGTVIADALDPSETSGEIPANTRIVDLFFDVPLTDAWGGCGLRAAAENGATLIYFDSDLGTPGLQPGLVNGGLANKFTTMLSKPRGRDAAERFTDGQVVVPGAYDPPSNFPETTPTLLNVGYFPSPPETPGSPSLDGYIARVAVDVAAVPEIPGFPKSDYANWGAGPIGSIPVNSRVVLRSTGVNQPGGTATITFDQPAFNFTNWAMWYVPEPTSLALLILGSVASIRRRCMP
jgi:hypothetical protein